jgi:hypothetical protein
MPSSLKTMMKMTRKQEAWLLMKVVRILRWKMVRQTKMATMKSLKMKKATLQMKNQAACIRKMTNLLMEKD